MDLKLMGLADAVLTELGGIGLEVKWGIEYKVNKRLKRTLGKCKRICDGHYLIEISEMVLAGDAAYTKQVIAHEILHTFPKCMNHGKEWKRLANIVNSSLGYTIDRLADRNEFVASIGEEAYFSRYKYKAECQGCGAEIYRMNRSKFIQNPQRYYCSKCGGKYIITEL